jgi:hypothetical protein
VQENLQGNPEKKKEKRHGEDGVEEFSCEPARTFDEDAQVPEKDARTPQKDTQMPGEGAGHSEKDADVGETFSDHESTSVQGVVELERRGRGGRFLSRALS